MISNDTSDRENMNKLCFSLTRQHLSKVALPSYLNHVFNTPSEKTKKLTCLNFKLGYIYKLKTLCDFNNNKEHSIALNMKRA
jgi:hypothetical protein